MSSDLKSMDEFHRLLWNLPHIAKNIELFWGHPELDVYLNKLFLDSRVGTRQGLPKDLAKDIYTIWNAHVL